VEPDQAAEQLRKRIDPKRAHTVADAAAASGLSLADSERGLHALVSEYRGHLRVTEEGQLVFVFPHGFSKPWETPDALKSALRRAGAAVAGAGRFVVRAWVAIVLVAYVAIFVALLVALAFGRSSERSDERSFSFAGPLLRLVFDALFWTMHPWSPFYVDVDDVMARRRLRRVQDAREQAPFYERVDRFFFGPRPEREDPDRSRRAILAEIRAGKGRIGLADVMRVTGESRERIDPLMSKLLLDYGGSVEVSEEGGIAYSFPELRKTADLSADLRRVEPIWYRREEPRPVTGNEPGQDVVIGGLNLFNLLASGWVLASGLTLERMIAMFRGVPPLELPPPGLPIALGLVPFVFSIALFLLPLGRAVLSPLRKKRAARENGRRAVLQTVLESAKSGGVSERELAERYRIASGLEADPKELTKQVVALGGDVDLERAAEGVRYRFPDLELEARAVEAEREAAGEEEAKIGPVVFTSEA
jgi:hypothetical protein